MEEFSVIPIGEVVLKSKSKKAIYNLLTTKGNIYYLLNEIHTISLFRKSFEGGELRKWSEVKVCKVPHLKLLNVGTCSNSQEKTLALVNSCLTLIIKNIKTGNGFEMFSILYLVKDSKSLYRQNKMRERNP